MKIGQQLPKLWAINYRVVFFRNAVYIHVLFMQLSHTGYEKQDICPHHADIMSPDRMPPGHSVRRHYDEDRLAI